MSRATDVELVIRQLKMLGGERPGTRRKIAQSLVDRLGWRVERATSAVQRAIDQDNRLHLGRGGTVVFSGADIAIYKRVAKAMLQWQPKKHWRIDDIMDCHARKGLRGQGDWQHPDLLVLADPRRRASQDAPLETHAIEVEHRGGFSIQSVYQAYEQGRGANYSWLVFVGDDAEIWQALCAQSRRVRMGLGGGLRERIVRAASERGVGLVLMEQSHSKSSWHELLSPSRRMTKDILQTDQDLLLRATGLPAERLTERTGSIGTTAARSRQRDGSERQPRERLWAGDRLGAGLDLADCTVDELRRGVVGRDQDE